jgi:hypothetical protein
MTGGVFTKQTSSFVGNQQRRNIYSDPNGAS